MKYIFFTLIISFSLSSLVKSQSFSGTNDSTLTYAFDIRQSDNSTNTLGLDFNIRYDIAQLSGPKANSPEGNKLDLSFALAGYQDFVKEATEFDFMTLELNVLGRKYNSKPVSLNPVELIYYKDLLEKSGVDPGSLTPTEQKNLAAFTKKLFNGRQFLSYKLGYKMESNQSLSFNQHMLQAGISLEVPKLHEVFEVFFSETRSSDMNYKAQPIRLYAGLDYILGANGAKEQLVDSTNVVPRARAEMAWRTLLFDNFELRATFESNYFFDEGNLTTTPTNELINFFQAWLVLPVSTDKTKVMLSYAKGKLPPLYTETAAGSIGVSFAIE